jgi:acyl carrier protein
MPCLESIIKSIRNSVVLNSNTPLYAQPEFDSLAIMALVSALESSFQIEIFPEDLVPENFQNVETIKALVIRNGGTLN